MNNKFSFDKGDAEKIENKALACKNCVFAYHDRVADCEIYNQKPVEVLKGADCKCGFNGKHQEVPSKILDEIKKHFNRKK